MNDPLAQVVSLLQPTLPFSKAASGSGVWRVDGNGKVEPFFCVILEGAMRLTIEGQDELHLGKDDFVLIPAACRFTMTSLETSSADGIDPLRVTKIDGETRHGDPDGLANMRTLVGHLAFGSPDAALLLTLLPAFIHIRGHKQFATIMRLIRNEALGERPARDMVLDHLLQVLLIEALRSGPESGASPGLLRGLADARLAVAIRQIHQEPDKYWTIEQLANSAALSRSVFFDRFRREVGISPMEYLVAWRMALAKNLLRRHEGGVKEVARRVGYGSASAFSVAFTRLVGMPPMQYARQARN